MFQLNKDLLYQMVMSMGLTRYRAEIDSVTVSVFVPFCFTSDLTNRESDTKPNNMFEYEIMRNSFIS